MPWFSGGIFPIEQAPWLSTHSHCLLRALQFCVSHLTPPPLLAVSTLLLRQGMCGDKRDSVLGGNIVLED